MTTSRRPSVRRRSSRAPRPNKAATLKTLRRGVRRGKDSIVVLRWGRDGRRDKKRSHGSEINAHPTGCFYVPRKGAGNYARIVKLDRRHGSGDRRG